MFGGVYGWVGVVVDGFRDGEVACWVLIGCYIIEWKVCGYLPGPSRGFGMSRGGGMVY